MYSGRKAEERGRALSSGKKTHAMPVFYRGNMYREGEGDAALLKLYNGKDWVWVSASLLHTDMEYLRKHWTGVKASAPTLEKRHRKYFLRFSYEENRELVSMPVQEQRICAVDLGLNTDAVCSIMEADGTVCARKFIGFADEKDRLWKVLNRIRRKSRGHGPKSVGSLWKYAVRCNEELSKKTAAAIVRFAQENHADVIVFEHLDMKGKIRGKRKMRLHIWKKRGSRRHVRTWRTGKGCGSRMYVPGRRAPLPMTVQEKWRGTPTTTACVRSETERDITVTFQRPII